MYNQRTLVISRRVRFYTRKQKDTESVTEFVAELKLLAAECEFDAFLDKVLCDIFAIGIGDRKVQRRKEAVCLGVECQVPSRQGNAYLCLEAFTK